MCEVLVSVLVGVVVSCDGVMHISIVLVWFRTVAVTAVGVVVVVVVDMVPIVVNEPTVV